MAYVVCSWSLSSRIAITAGNVHTVLQQLSGGGITVPMWRWIDTRDLSKRSTAGLNGKMETIIHPSHGRDCEAVLSATWRRRCRGAGAWCTPRPSRVNLSPRESYHVVCSLSGGSTIFSWKLHVYGTSSMRTLLRCLSRGCLWQHWGVQPIYCVGVSCRKRLWRLWC